MIETPIGRMIVLQIFGTRFEMNARCRVLNGSINRSSRISLVRYPRIIGNYNIASLRNNDDSAFEVSEGMNCDIRLENFNDIGEGDLLEAFE